LILDDQNSAKHFAKQLIMSEEDFIKVSKFDPSHHTQYNNVMRMKSSTSRALLFHSS
jgi:hypothetical protein